MNILIIGKVWPEPASSAAGSRMVQLMEVLKEGGHTLHFGSAAMQSRYSVDPADMGVESHALQMNDPSFDSLIAELQPDVVIYDRFMTEEQFGWRVHEVSSDSIHMLNTEDLHFLRVAREQNPDQPDFNRDETWRELAAMYRCDLNLIISEAEMDLIKHHFHFDADRLHYLPLLFDTGSINPENLPCFEDREGFCTIGNMKHKPNRDAVMYLKKEIWPLIRRKLPDARMHVYGAYTPESMMQLSDVEEGFQVHGRAESAESILKKHRVMLAPLRFGAGLKGKLLEAMQYGMPSVTTGMGAEGIADEESWPGFLANTPESFGDGAVQVYTEPAIWRDAVDKGHHILSEHFDRNMHAKPFLQRLDQLKVTVKLQRQSNYIGSMLRHQSLNASRYMGKWIEKKNKK
jgi:glycosyltransferase involved in cell wall biosynthesis